MLSLPRRKAGRTSGQNSRPMRFVIDSTDAVRTRALADTVLEKWRAGANYDSLAAKYHDPAEEKTLLDGWAVDSLPEVYKVALKGVIATKGAKAAIEAAGAAGSADISLETMRGLARTSAGVSCISRRPKWSRGKKSMNGSTNT